MIDHDADMRLPEGKACGDCTHYNRCRQLFGCRDFATKCDWSPSRFQQKAPPAKPGVFAADDAAAIRAAAERIRAEEAAAEPECGECEDSGHVLSSYQAFGGPNFETCPRCGNPKGLPSP